MRWEDLEEENLKEENIFIPPELSYFWRLIFY